jgi:hypothetical protein
MKKDQARERAIELNDKLSNMRHPSWEDVIIIQSLIRKIGKRAGLLREFRENGLI